MLLAYAAKLNAIAEANRAKEQARREERARAEAQAAREQLTPLDERLTRLLATIPIEVQREGLALASLQASLRGLNQTRFVFAKVMKGVSPYDAADFLEDLRKNAPTTLYTKNDWSSR